MEQTIDGGLLIANMMYGIDNGVIEKLTHIKIIKSMLDFYDKSGFITGSQINYVNRLLAPVAIPTGLTPLPFRESRQKRVVTPVSDSKKITNRAILYKENKAKLIFDYDSDMVKKIKTLSGRRYIQDERTWVIPLSYQSLGLLKDWGFVLGPDLRKWHKDQLNPTPIHLDNIPGLKLPLLPFQLEGVEFLEMHGGNALIADEMGLGKTPQSLAYLQLHPDKIPAIIVCPASLKWNWHKEAHKFMNKPEVQVLSGKKIVPITGDIIVVNYDILPDTTELRKTGKRVKDRETGAFKDEKKRFPIPGTGWWSYLRDINPQVLIIDEIHKIKDKDAQRTAAVTKIAKKAKHVIGLSGTPIVNRPVEFYNPINIINPYLFPSFMDFAIRYCGANRGQFGWDFNGSTNTKELHDILSSTLMIRRLKKDVQPQLPEKIRTVLPIEITNRKKYQRAEADFITYLKSFDTEAAKRAEKAVHLAKLEALKKLAVDGKIKECTNWISDFLDTGQKLVVFTHHRDILAQLAKTFRNICVKVEGGMTNEDRHISVETFQKNPTKRLFLGNIEAASVGHTLTAASNVAYIEYPWTPGILVQSEDRVHRIGQTADTTNYWYLVARDTIEEGIIEMLEEKSVILDQVLDGKDETESGSILNDMLDQLKDREI